MTRQSFVTLAACLALALPAVAAADIPKPCTEAAMADVVHPDFFLMNLAQGKIDLKDALSRGLQLPVEQVVLDYPYGSLDVYGFELTLIVDTAGKIECATVEPAYGAEGPAINNVRRRFLEEVAGWQAKPYEVDGKPVRATTTLSIPEAERPARHVPKPRGNPAEVTITQDVAPFFATYWPYHVELHGDGTAIYTSRDPEDPLGPQSYRVDPKAVQGVIALAEAADFWSLRDLYRSPNQGDFDRSFDRLNITLGGTTKSLTNRGGEQAGLHPRARMLMGDVMAAANVDFWQTPTVATLDQLKANGFDFTTAQAGKLLLRMMENPRVGDDAVLALMDLGVPLGEEAYTTEVPVEAALRSGRVAVAKRLIAGDALMVDLAPDPDRVNWAFYAAVESCSVEAIDLMLPYKPDMTYSDEYGDGDTQVPVIRRLGGERPYLRDCVAAAEKLIALGQNANAAEADGSTLLHTVGLSVALARLLIDHGADVNAMTKDGWTPLSKTYYEDVALLLLERGADPRRGKSSHHLRFNIEGNYWTRVEAWLKSHGYGDVLIEPAKDEA